MKGDTKKPASAVWAMSVGEHTSSEAQRLCRWLTRCLRKKISGNLFEKMWRKVEGEDFDGLRWESAPYNLPGFYAHAIKNGASCFIICDDNSFVSIVALRGNPGAKAIEKCVVKYAPSAVMTMGSGHWPSELGPGAPIKCLGFAVVPAYYAALRNGKYVSVDEDYHKATHTVHLKLFVDRKFVRKYSVKLKEEDKLINVVKAKLAKLQGLKTQKATSGYWELFQQLNVELSWLDVQERMPCVSEVAEMLLWDEIALDVSDRSTKTRVLRILARYGDKSVVPAIKEFAKKVRGLRYDQGAKRSEMLRMCDQRSVKKAIAIIRYPNGNEHHPDYPYLDMLI